MQRSSLVLIVMLFAGGCTSAPEHEAPKVGRDMDRTVVVTDTYATTTKLDRKKVSYPDYHALPRARAELAAERYTHDLDKASGASLSLGSRF